MSVRHLFCNRPRNVVDFGPRHEDLTPALPDPSGPPAPRSWRRRRVGGPIVGAGLTGTASAQDVEGTRAKVQRLAAEMDRLEARASSSTSSTLQTGLES